MYVCICMYVYIIVSAQNEANLWLSAKSMLLGPSLWIWNDFRFFDKPTSGDHTWQPQNGGFCSESQTRFIKGYHSFGIGVCLGISLILNPNQSWKTSDFHVPILHLPSGKRANITGKSPFWWENPLFLSMAMASSSQTTWVITRPLVRHRNLGHTPGMTGNGRAFFTWASAGSTRRSPGRRRTWWIWGFTFPCWCRGGRGAWHGFLWAIRCWDFFGIIIIGIWRINGYLLAN